MSALPSSLVQRVVSGGASGDVRTERSAPRETPIIFELELVDPNEDLDLPYSTFAEQPKLLPGGNYQARILARSYRTGDPLPTYVSPRTKLFLCCSKVAEISISTTSWNIDDDEPSNMEKVVELNVAAECPAGEFELELFYIDERKNRRPVTKRSFELQGTFYPAERDLLERCGIVLNETLPHNTAILHIEAPQPNVYQLTGWSYRQRPLRIGPIEQPTVTLADFIEKELEPEHIKANLSSYSRRNPKALLDWFNGLEERHGEDLNIIIADHSVSELPWEMIEITRGKYIGAVWKVVRWIPIRDFRVSRDLDVAENEIAGNVLAYLHHKELDTDLERNALERLIHNYCDDIKGLKQALAQPRNSAALVYLGCHGMFAASEKHLLALGGLTNPSENLISLDIEAMEMRLGLRPFLFVNACHSARLIRDSNGFYGLPEVFLARIASAYMGTVGPVGSSYASEIAKFMLTQALEKSIQPAEILRQLRANAVDRVTKSGNREDYLNFVYTFMYVYYGDPFMKIKLDPMVKQEQEV